MGLHVDHLLVVDERTIYVRGWARSDADGGVTDLTLVSPQGERLPIGSESHRFRRHDVADFYGDRPSRQEKHGFACTTRTRLPVADQDGWLIEARDGIGRASELPVGPVVRSGTEVQQRLLSDLAIERPPADDLRRRHLAPAITTVLSARRREVRIVEVEQWGEAPSSPVVSIVVPLYRRIDFLEHQLSLFSHDPEVAAADLIYVLDSPEQEEQLRDLARRLLRMHELPFRTVTLNQNAGFSEANNQAVTLARGRLLLLLNSDVLPDRPGWLGRLVGFHDDIADVGAVGPKLLYEDESIQHAGMWFERAVGEALWANDHVFKGMHRSFGPACVSREVPAVTAACLLMDTERYRAVGGLRGTFVQGDYEDSDLCLRLRRAGRSIWYCADVELYHLEGQSYPNADRVRNAQYNRWLHHVERSEQISALMEGIDPTNDARRLVG